MKSAYDILGLPFMQGEQVSVLFSSIKKKLENFLREAEKGRTTLSVHINKISSANGG